jgi:hypothetical protein
MAHRSLVARGSLLAIVGLLTGLASCSQAPNSTPAAQSSAAPAATAPAAAPAAGAAPAAAPMAGATAIASAQYSEDPSLRADLLEVKRVSGGALLIRWRLVNTAASQQGAGLVAGGASKVVNYGGWSWTDLYYTDPAENKKYGFLSDTEGNRLLDVYSGDVQPGQERDNWSKFPAPPATSTKVTIYIPKFPPFEDTPIS